MRCGGIYSTGVWRRWLRPNYHENNCDAILEVAASLRLRTPSGYCRARFSADTPAAFEFDFVLNDFEHWLKDPEAPSGAELLADFRPVVVHHALLVRQNDYFL